MKRTLLFWATASVALWTAACGGGGTTITTPPPNNGFSASNLKGQYAFSMSGTDASTGTAVPFARVGSFTADGLGNITGGVEDVNLNLAQEGSVRLAFTGGSYTVGSDGRGSLTLNNSTGSLTFSISLTSSTAGYIILMPTDTLAGASGNFILQNSASFSVGGVTGNYALDFSGTDSAGNAESFVGQLTSNGGGSFTSGVGDDNDGGTINGGGADPAPISGSYNIDSLNTGDLSAFGRGVFTINGAVTGVFYVVGPNQIKFLETGTGGTLAGDGFAQSNIPTTTAGVTGPFVYVMGGSTVSNSGFGPLARGGKFSANAGNLSSVIVDTNNAGGVQSLPSSGTGTGTYTIDSAGSGRGTMTFTLQGSSVPFNYVFYMISPTQAFVQEQSSGPNGAVIEDGSMFAQGSGTISASSLAANYGINWSGVTVTNGGSVAGEEDVSGETTLSSTGGITGTIDLNELATVGPVPDISLSGSFTLNSDPTSHNPVTLNLATNPAIKVTAFAYVAGNNNILLLTTENVRIATGAMTPQNP